MVIVSKGILVNMPYIVHANPPLHAYWNSVGVWNYRRGYFPRSCETYEEALQVRQRAIKSGGRKVRIVSVGNTTNNEGNYHA